MRYLIALLFALPVSAAELSNPFGQLTAPKLMGCRYEYVLSLEFYGGQWRYIPVQIVVCDIP